MIFSHVHLDFDFRPYLDADYTHHSGSCVKHQIHELKDLHQQFGGFPASYCLANTMIHQLWWTADQISFDDLGRQLDMNVITVSTIKQPPGCVVPYHNDTFFQIKQRHPDRTEAKVRANIFMEDYRLGHFIQYTLDHKHTVSANWQSGDGYIWDSDVLHLSANAGMEDKYTMQVSGFLLEEIRNENSAANH
jgi:hypothetical protein